MRAGGLCGVAWHLARNKLLQLLCSQRRRLLILLPRSPQVARHDNPYDAAKALVAQAYKLWLQKETRTDDITCVVIFFDHEQDASDMSGGNTTAAAGAAAQEPTQSTPPQAVEPSSRLALLRTPSSKQAGAGDAEAVPVAITASDGS